MKKSLFVLLALLTIGLVYTGCKEKKPVTDPEDLENPEIFMSSPEIKQLGEYIDLNNSDSLNIDIRFEDDVELRDYEITIRANRDLAFLKTNSDPWKETWFGSLDGTSQGINFNVFVVFDPDAGPYEFRVKVTDEAGKSSEVVTYLWLTNLSDPNPPVITFTAPDPNLIDTFNIGQDIVIDALVNDPGNEVRDVYLRVRNDFSLEVLPESEMQWDTIFMPSYQVDTFVNIPAGTAPGRYLVEILATDNVINWGKGVDTIYVKPN